MKKTKKLILFFTIMIAGLFAIPTLSNAATSVNDEESLNSAVSSINSGETITLENDKQ